MPSDKRIGRRLVGLFLLGMLLLNFPLLDLANRPVLILGLPLLYLYLFGVWSLIILLIHLISRCRPDPTLPPKDA